MHKPDKRSVDIVDQSHVLTHVTVQPRKLRLEGLER